ncbi:MAG: UDP-N-acetylmuramate dehydrogenase [Deferribacterales bacterium]
MEDLSRIIKEFEPLSKHCSYRTGGPARYFATPKNLYDLNRVMEFIQSNTFKYIIIGNGSNVLFDDRGFDGVVISLKYLNRYMFIDGEIFIAGAGVLLDDAVEYSILNNLTGMEELSGIPGTIGGAVFMNAGAFNTEMKDIIYAINLYEGGIVRKISNEEANFSYRRSSLEGKIVLEVEMNLKRSKNVDITKRYDILNRRAMKQPLEYPSCGSVFKRPEGSYAGKLIEEAGLKGFSIGGAKISEKHANFIVNYNNATSDDIKRIIEFVKKKVYEETGVMLEEEVKIIDY